MLHEHVHWSSKETCLIRLQEPGLKCPHYHRPPHLVFYWVLHLEFFIPIVAAYGRGRVHLWMSRWAVLEHLGVRYPDQGYLDTFWKCIQISVKAYHQLLRDIHYHYLFTPLQLLLLTSRVKQSLESLQAIWKSNQYSLNTKNQLYNSDVKSVLQYGLECLRVTWKRSTRSTMDVSERHA